MKLRNILDPSILRVASFCFAAGYPVGVTLANAIFELPSLPGIARSILRSLTLARQFVYLRNRRVGGNAQ